MIFKIHLVATSLGFMSEWGSMDFLIAGSMLVGAGLLVVLIFRRVKSVRTRIALFSAVFLIFLLIWAELAVGVFGSKLAGS